MRSLDLLLGLGLAAPCLATPCHSKPTYEGYAFAYFTDSSTSGENIFLAASNGNDALSWTTLNAGQPILTSSYGTGGLRDPFLIRSPDGGTFYLIATDLSIGSGTSWDEAVRRGSLFLEVWESSDLITWSEQRHVQVSPDTAGNTWAPEAYFDDTIGEFVVFWASSLYDEADTEHTGTTYHRMLYATTTDFVTFSETVVWQDAGMSRIDSTVLEVDDVYYRFTKDEGGGGTGCVDIIQERSSELRATLDSWTQVTSCIGANAGTSSVEGPTIFRSNPGDVNGDKFYLFVDEFVDRGYIPLATDDIASPDWQVPSSYTLPPSPRHGTVLSVTAAELEALHGAYSTSPVLEGYYADPNIIAVNCTYYIYATSDGYADWGGKEFYVWSSPDLVAWTRDEEPFLTLDGENGNVPWAVGNAWAPTMIPRDGKYYFFHSGHYTGTDDKAIGVAVADSPHGPFTAQAEPIIFNNESITSSQAIDPFAFEDPVSGKFFLLWGNGTPLKVELNEDMVSLNWDTLQAMETLVEFREGLFVNYRQGQYHLTYSINDTRSEDYSVGYATATELDGPWTYQGVVLKKDAELGLLGTGHNSVLNVPGTDEWYMAYHRFAIPDGDGTHRETTIDVVTFDEEGFMEVVVPTLESVAARTIPGCSL